MRKAIAINFDGCLCTDAYPSIGEPNWPVIKQAQAEQRTGAGLILWTCREGDLLQEAVSACEGWGLTFDAVNESLPDWIEAFGNRPRKVGASEYWDDKAARIPVAQRFFVGGPGDDSIELIEPKPNAELKPCPFCGSAHVIYERYGAPAGERWRCWCAECLAGIDPGTAQEAGQVREMWNRRSDPPNDPLTLEELRKMDGEPVWLVGVSSINNFRGHWDICNLGGDSPAFPYCGENPDINLYGIMWKAYRRKPEEVGQ